MTNLYMPYLVRSPVISGPRVVLPIPRAAPAEGKRDGSSGGLLVSWRSLTVPLVITAPGLLPCSTVPLVITAPGLLSLNRVDGYRRLQVKGIGLEQGTTLDSQKTDNPVTCHPNLSEIQILIFLYVANLRGSDDLTNIRFKHDQFVP